MAESDFEEYVEARTGALLRLAYLLCGNAHTAEEYMEIASLVPRAQAMALAILRLPAARDLV